MTSCGFGFGGQQIYFAQNGTNAHKAWREAVKNCKIIGQDGVGSKTSGAGQGTNLVLM
jgi:hypothetical protein